jgi:DNA-binding beta-propeller fold protein YncE
MFFRPEKPVPALHSGGSPQGPGLGAILALLLALLFVAPAAHASALYVGNAGTTNNIERFDAAGNGTVFANQPGSGLAFNSAHILYASVTGPIFSQQGTIYRFDSSGTPTTFATGLAAPVGLAFDLAGNLFVANNGNNTILKFDSSGNSTVFAAASQGLNGPAELAFDSKGNLFVANDDGDNILKFTPSGQGSIFADATAGVSKPFGLAFDTHGNLYVSTNTDSILRFDPSGQVSTFANQGLDRPTGLAFDNAGNLFVANELGDNILRFDAGGHGSVFADSSQGVGTPVGLVFGPAAAPEPSGMVLLLSAAGLLGVYRCRGGLSPRRCPAPALTAPRVVKG